MKTKMSKSDKIRAAIKAGKSTKEIVENLKVPISSVYTVRWRMKKEAAKKRVVITSDQAFLAKKLGVPLEIYARELIKAKSKKVGRPKKVQIPPAPKVSAPTPVRDFVLQEMVNIEHQIDRLNTIRSFLSIRLQQLEQSGE